MRSLNQGAVLSLAHQGYRQGILRSQGKLNRAMNNLRSVVKCICSGSSNAPSFVGLGPAPSFCEDENCYCAGVHHLAQRNATVAQLAGTCTRGLDKIGKIVTCPAEPGISSSLENPALQPCSADLACRITFLVAHFNLASRYRSDLHNLLKQ